MHALTQGDPDHDNSIFALAVLLSSTLVYNVLNIIEEGSLGVLKYPCPSTGEGNVGNYTSATGPRLIEAETRVNIGHIHHSDLVH